MSILKEPGMPLQEPWQEDLRETGWTIQLERRILVGNERPALPDNLVPAGVANIIRACWKEYSHDRPSMQEVVKDLERLVAGSQNRP